MTTEAAQAPRGVETGEVAAPEDRRRNLRPILWVAGVIAALLIVIWGVRYYSYAHVHQTTDDAHIDANTVSVSTKVSERVAKIMADTGKPVHRGQLLVVLDNTTERAAVDQARANLELAMENQTTLAEQGMGGVTQAQGGASAAQAQVQAAQAALPGAQQALARALADYRRTQSLVASGDLPSQQLDAAHAAYAQAQSQYRAAQDNVDAAIANASAAQGGVQTAQGKLSQARAPALIAAQRATLAIAMQNLSNTQIRSPIDGYVGERNVEVGQTVNPGTTLLTLIPNKVFITANYKETQIGKMRVGQPVDIHVDAYRGVAFHGRVVAINPASQNTYALVPSQNSTGNFVKVTQRIPVKISIDDADPKRYPLRPGMSVVTSVLIR